MSLPEFYQDLEFIAQGLVLYLKPVGLRLSLPCLSIYKVLASRHSLKEIKL